MTIAAKIIADSISPAGVRLTTMQLRYPKFIHGEFMTHRVFSRNASSSRAIPVARLLADVVQDKVYPSHWGANKPGMQADAEHSAPVALRVPVGPDAVVGIPGTQGEEVSREAAWDMARQAAVDFAEALARAGYHKQIVNRLIEPFCHINVVVTATEWSNFFALRDHEGAQPEMRALAREMRAAMMLSEPAKLAPGEWHLPYVTPENFLTVGRRAVDQTHLNNTLIRLSVARCARVSYLTQDGKQPEIADDLQLYERLVGAVPLHASPAEHQATPDTQWADGETWSNLQLHGNFKGWVQFRKTLLGECQ